MKQPLSLTLLFLALALKLSAQVHENKEGNFKVSVIDGWNVRVNGSTSDIQAPEEGPLDAWTEFLGISVNPSEGTKLTDAFNFYMTEDFPGYYPQFKILKKGEETINGIKAAWALYSFSTSTEIQGGETKGATLNNLFYLIEKDDVFYYLNGIAEESLYPKYEASFLQMIRSFKPAVK